MIITIGGMNKDIKKLQVQTKMLQDLVTAQGKRISELERRAHGLPPAVVLFAKEAEF